MSLLHNSGSLAIQALKFFQTKMPFTINPDSGFLNLALRSRAGEGHLTLALCFFFLTLGFCVREI